VSRSTFIRISALSAILAGALRAIASFIPEVTPHIYVLYFVIDLSLLSGIIGIYRFCSPAAKLLSVLGFAIMLIALTLLIARDLTVAPAGIYAGAAALFLVGLDLFSIQALRTRRLPSWIPVVWILSTIVGPIGLFIPGLHFLFPLSGLLFGIAFAGAGVVMIYFIGRPL